MSKQKYNQNYQKKKTRISYHKILWTSFPLQHIIPQIVQLQMKITSNMKKEEKRKRKCINEKDMFTFFGIVNQNYELFIRISLPLLKQNQILNLEL